MSRYTTCRRCAALPEHVNQFNARHYPAVPMKPGQVIADHGALDCEGARGFPEGVVEVYRCADCGRFWQLFMWWSMGCFQLTPHAPCPECDERVEVRARGVFWGEIRLQCDACGARYSLETSGEPPGMPEAIRGAMQ